MAKLPARLFGREFAETLDTTRKYLDDILELPYNLVRQTLVRHFLSAPFYKENHCIESRCVASGENYGRAFDDTSTYRDESKI